MTRIILSINAVELEALYWHSHIVVIIIPVHPCNMTPTSTVHHNTAYSSLLSLFFFSTSFSDFFFYNLFSFCIFFFHCLLLIGQLVTILFCLTVTFKRESIILFHLLAIWYTSFFFNRINIANRRYEYFLFEILSLNQYASKKIKKYLKYLHKILSKVFFRKYIIKCLRISWG